MLIGAEAVNRRTSCADAQAGGFRDNGAVNEYDHSKADEKFGDVPLSVHRSLEIAGRFARFKVKTGRRRPASSPRVWYA